MSGTTQPPNMALPPLPLSKRQWILGGIRVAIILSNPNNRRSRLNVVDVPERLLAFYAPDVQSDVTSPDRLSKKVLHIDVDSVEKAKPLAFALRAVIEWLTRFAESNYGTIKVRVVSDTLTEAAWELRALKILGMTSEAAKTRQAIFFKLWKTPLRANTLAAILHAIGDCPAITDKVVENLAYYRHLDQLEDHAAINAYLTRFKPGLIPAIVAKKAQFKKDEDEVVAKAAAKAAKDNARAEKQEKVAEERAARLAWQAECHEAAQKRRDEAAAWYAQTPAGYSGGAYDQRAIRAGEKTRAEVAPPFAFFEWK